MNETKEKIIELLTNTKRQGIPPLLDYLITDGFFESPASTRFYGCYKGGLAKHSLWVYETLSIYNEQFDLGKARSPGQKPLTLGLDNIKIAALLHDVCKVGAYLGDEKPYRWNKAQPKGHATLSIERIKKHIELTEIEELMIRYHMGVYGLNEFYEKGSWEFETSAEYPLGTIEDIVCDLLGHEEYPLRGDHSKDEKLTKEESQKARYGKSLRNAWYHNPICKLMYFCDELQVMGEKAAE